MTPRGRLAMGSVVVATALVAGQVVAAAPAGVADERFEAIDGPMADVLIAPEDFSIDPDRTLVDVAALLSSVDGDRARAFVEALSFPRTASGPAPARQAAVDLVADGLADAGYAPQLGPVTRQDVTTSNVYADLPGTQCPDRVLVIGAHWDSAHATGQGADDNATGVAGMLEVARALRDHPLPLTVRFASFAFEEAGYVGSRSMADGMAADGVDVAGGVSFDMIGYTTPAADPLSGLPAGDYLVVVSDPDSAGLPQAFAAGAYRHTPEVPLFGLVIDPEVLPDINRSDHASFERAGFDGMIANDVGAVRNPHYHEATDAPATLDWEFLTGNARALLAGTATFGSLDDDEDGTADICAGPLPAPLAAPPTTTTTTSGPSSTTAPTPASPAPGGAPAAEPIRGQATYSG